jgi:hypothetical protein
MVKEKKVENKEFFQCDVCGHGYLDEETARKCELYCRKNGTSCPEITKKAVYFPSLPTHLDDMGEK